VPWDWGWKPCNLTFALFVLEINIKSPLFFWTKIFREHLPRLLVVLEGVMSLETFPSWSGTKQNLQIYLVSLFFFFLWVAQTWHFLVGHFYLLSSLFTIFWSTCFRIWPKSLPGGFTWGLSWWSWSHWVCVWLWFYHLPPSYLQPYTSFLL
jgi:hypothetical protein